MRWPASIVPESVNAVLPSTESSVPMSPTYQKSRFKKEVEVFLTAVMFYTRIPCPRWIGHSPDLLAKATRYFPMIGWIVGGVSAMVLYATGQLLPISISILFSMITGILLTGAFHEDGFADVCDGFGGGWTKSKILDIMKDSRVGAYGLIGMVLILPLKYLLLFEIYQAQGTLCLALALLSGHSLSRSTAASMIYTHEYVRENEDSKAKPVAKRMSINTLIMVVFSGLAPILLFGNPLLLCIVLPVYAMKAYLARYFKKWIGGYTGDCLGAVQQISEIIIYLSLLSLWKFI